MKKVSAFVAAAVLAGHCLCAQPGWTADSPSGTGGVEASGSKPDLTQGSLSAYDLPAVTAFGVADQPPTVPVQTRFGTQYNVVTEEQIRLQNSLDFYDALRNVPGVMYQKKNIIGGQTSASLYVRGRGASHPSPDINIYFDDVPRSGVLYGQALADGIPVYALGGIDIYIIFFRAHAHVFGHSAVAAAFCADTQFVAFLGHVFGNEIEHGIAVAKA